MTLDTSQQVIRPVTGTHVVRVQHEGLATADAERAKDFYCRVLGFQVLPRPAFSSGGYWLGPAGTSSSCATTPTATRWSSSLRPSDQPDARAVEGRTRPRPRRALLTANPADNQI